MDTDGQNPSSEISISELICPESQIVEEIGRLVDIVNPKKSKTNLDHFWSWQKWLCSRLWLLEMHSTSSYVTSNFVYRTIWS